MRSAKERADRVLELIRGHNHREEIIKNWCLLYGTTGAAVAADQKAIVTKAEAEAAEHKSELPAKRKRASWDCEQDEEKQAKAKTS